MTQSRKRTKSTGKHGGNRPGSGRPLTGGYGRKANFSTRLSQKTRDLLEAEARAEARRAGRAVSISRTAERLLKDALEKKSADLLRPEELRGLFFLIEVLTWFVSGSRYNDSQYSWVNHPYFFEAFRRAIPYLMSVMRPLGEAAPPPPEPKPEREHPNIYTEAGDEMMAAFQREEFPSSIDEYARELARRVIERAQTEMAFVDRGHTGKRIVTLQGEEEEVGPDEEDDYATRTSYNLSEAARKLFRRGK